MKVLILPDWMTTPVMYNNIAEKLNAEVYTYEDSDLANRVVSLRKYLKKHEYECIVGFGIGAWLALSVAKDEKLILINPVLKGNITRLSSKFDKEGFEAMRVTQFSSTLILKFLVGSWGNITQELVKYFRTCDVDTETHILYQMSSESLGDSFGANNVHTVIVSKGDKLCHDEQAKELAERMHANYVNDLKGGHLIIFDCPDDVVKEIKEAL